MRLQRSLPECIRQSLQVVDEMRCLTKMGAHCATRSRIRGVQHLVSEAAGRGLVR